MTSGLRSKALADRARKVLAGGVNSNFRMAASDAFIDTAKGSRLVDVNGREFVDYVLGMGVALLGHSPEAVLEAVADAQSRLQCPAAQHELEVELAEKIVEAVPSADLVRVGCTGSEMVQLALRLARAATGRRLVVKFEGHYHGWFDNIFAGTTLIQEDGGVRPSTPMPQSAGQATSALEDLIVLPWNDLPLLDGFLHDRGTDVAAIIMEPVCCNTSVITPRNGYLNGVRDLCDRYGIVLVFDEVITGFRLAEGGAQSCLGVRPDLTVLGKALGAGFPIAALAGSDSLMRLVADGGVMHGGTYNGNAMAVAAACATLDILHRCGSELYGGLYSLANDFVAQLTLIGHEYGGSLAVQHYGPVINTTFDPPSEIVDYRSYQRTNLAKQRRFRELLQEEGVRVTSRGTWFLSASHTAQDVELTTDAVRRTLGRML